MTREFSPADIKRNPKCRRKVVTDGMCEIQR